MARTGIDNPWRSEDDPDREPEPIEEWIDAGISREEGEIWRRWRFRLQAAMAWRGAAVLDGLRAAQWMTAGATPETVNEWRAAAIDATEAVSWHELRLLGRGGPESQGKQPHARRRLPAAVFAEPRDRPGERPGDRLRDECCRPRDGCCRLPKNGEGPRSEVHRGWRAGPNRPELPVEAMARR